MTEPIVQDQAGKDFNPWGKLVRATWAVFPVLLLSLNSVIYYAMHQQHVWLDGDDSWRTDTFELAHRWMVPIASAVYVTGAVTVIAVANTVCLIFFIIQGKNYRAWLPGFITAIVSTILCIMLFS